MQARDGQTRDRGKSLAVCLFLALAVWIVFGQTLRHGFVNYDDDHGVYENPGITQGLTRGSVTWAFTHTLNGNWVPLTALSHMLDCQLYRLHPWGHHLTSVLLHLATVVALFLVLRELTGAFWRSAFVAAIFAIHPLRVESVAWVAERKDVLSGFFFMLTIAAYLRYAENLKFQISNFKFFYTLALVLFALGLMAKPMLVTLPLVLWLLDYWPLQRTESARRLVMEKIPFLALSAADSVATLLAQHAAVQTFQQVDFFTRVCNALVSCAVYIGQMVYPAGLAVFYPFPEPLPIWKAGCAFVILCGLSACVLAGRRKHPYLLTGWLWSLVMLMPVMGLVQVGGQARADRYTYLPQIGLYILAAWGAVELCGRWRWRRVVLGVGASAILACLLAVAYQQTSYWNDSLSLWTHALACTSDNHIAHNNLGVVLAGLGKLDEAIQQYNRTLEIKPDYATAHNNLGLALARQGKSVEAIPHYERALQLQPDFAEAHFNLGNALADQRKLAEAITQYKHALELRPDFAEAHNNLGNTLAKQGNLVEAVPQFESALRLKPDDVQARYNLGNALARQGKLAEAVPQFEQTLRLKPDFAEAHNNLGNALAGQGKLAEAVTQFEQALQFKHDYAEAHYNLGNALAAQGKLTGALQHLQQALTLASAQHQTAMAEAIRRQIASYQAALPSAPAR